MLFRIVVATNEVHIVQRNKTSISYWKDQGDWNVYYNWPSWFPFIGITKIVLPVSNFNIELSEYEAYDQQKVPFEVDVIWFFRISDPVKAAQRISSFEDLQLQLSSVMNGAIRKVLAWQTIIEIMESRNEISDEFTKEVSSQLMNWWVESVKNVELMDIRDSQNSESNVISNIMIRKTSEIERESRIEVANNKRDAEVAEIDAKRSADVQRQDAEKQIWEKTAEKEKAIWIAKEKSKQEIQTEAKITSEKDMEVLKITEIKKAEIAKEKAIIEANKEKEKKIIEAEALKLEQGAKAEADLITSTKKADWQLVTMTKNAEGIKLEWAAQAESKRLLELALIAWQIELAEKIANSPSYIEYLSTIRAIEAGEKVWMSKAEALKNADMKVIANSWDVNSWFNSILDIVSSKWWTAIWSLLDNLKNTEVWNLLLEKLLSKNTSLDNTSKEENKIIKEEEDTTEVIDWNEDTSIE